MLHVCRYGRLFFNMSIHAARRLWHFGLTDLVTRDAARGSLDVWRTASAGRSHCRWWIRRVVALHAVWWSALSNLATRGADKSGVEQDSPGILCLHNSFSCISDIGRRWVVMGDKANAAPSPWGSF